MNKNLQIHAAEVIPAAFGAVPAGLPVPAGLAVPAGLSVSAMRDCVITNTEMTKYFGQVRPPRKIPL